MTTDGPPEGHNNDRTRPLLRRFDQATVAVIVAVSLLLIFLSYAGRQLRRDGLIEIDRAAPQVIEFRVDVNRADWPELTLLPEVGETLARRIVESREREGPYLDHQDLLRVNGIGPRTLESIRPYLLPLPDANELAGP
jgi:competence protein ComEA